MNLAQGIGDSDRKVAKDAKDEKIGSRGWNEKERERKKACVCDGERKRERESVCV